MQRPLPYYFSNIHLVIHSISVIDLCELISPYLQKKCTILETEPVLYTSSIPTSYLSVKTEIVYLNVYWVG